MPTTRALGRECDTINARPGTNSQINPATTRLGQIPRVKHRMSCCGPRVNQLIGTTEYAN
jgi:hypothetical protein